PNLAPAMARKREERDAQNKLGRHPFLTEHSPARERPLLAPDRHEMPGGGAANDVVQLAHRCIVPRGLPILGLQAKKTLPDGDRLPPPKEPRTDSARREQCPRPGADRAGDDP